MAVTTEKSKPKRKYTRRKIMATADRTQDTTVPTESSFMEGLRKAMDERAQQIKDEINAIDNQMTTMTDQRASLIDEQEKVENGLKALEKN